MKTAPDLRKPPPRPGADRRRRLAALADWHLEWVRENLNGSEFTPRGEGSDYNLHHLDVDGASAGAEAEFQARAREIVGINVADEPPAHAERSARLDDESVQRVAAAVAEALTRSGLIRFDPDQLRDSHGRWVDVPGVGEILSAAEAALDYGDEVGRADFGDQRVVARASRTLTVEVDAGDGNAKVFAAPSAADAHRWATMVDDVAEAEDADPSPNGMLVWDHDDGFFVGRDEQGDVAVRFVGDADSNRLEHSVDKFDGFDLSREEADGFAEALRDMAYAADDHATIEDERLAEALSPRRPSFATGSQVDPTDVQPGDTLISRVDPDNPVEAEVGRVEKRRGPDAGFTFYDTDDLPFLEVGNGGSVEIRRDTTRSQLAGLARSKAHWKLQPRDRSGDDAGQWVKSPASAVADALKALEKAATPDERRAAVSKLTKPQLVDVAGKTGVKVTKSAVKSRILEELAAGGRVAKRPKKAPRSKPVSGPDIEVVGSLKDLTPTQLARGENLTPAGRDALDALGPTGHPRVAAIPDTEGKIREAYRMLAVPGGGKDNFVALTDLRKLIGNQVPRDDVDAKLREMNRDMPDVRIESQSYARENRVTRIPAAVVIGGQEHNLLHIEDPALARPSQFAAVAMAEELLDRQAGRPGDPMMARISDVDLRVEIDRRVARDPVVAQGLASLQGWPPSVTSAKKAAPITQKAKPSSLTPAQKAAISRYKNNDLVADRINTRLRRGGPATPEVRQIDAAMAASQLDRDMQLYRGLNELPAKGYPSRGPGMVRRALGLDPDKPLPDNLVGHEFVEPGFASTSTRRTLAEVFGSGDRGVLLEISAPRGTHAVPIPRSREGEILLDRGLKYRVVGDRTETEMVGIGGDEPLHKRVLTVDIVPPAAGPTQNAKTPAKKAAAKGSAKAPFDPAAIAARLEQARSRDEAHELLKGKTVAQLKAISKEAGIPLLSTRRQDIVEGLVGFGGARRDFGAVLKVHGAKELDVDERAVGRRRSPETPDAKPRRTLGG